MLRPVLLALSVVIVTVISQVAVEVAVASGLCLETYGQLLRHAAVQGN